MTGGAVVGRTARWGTGYRERHSETGLEVVVGRVISIRGGQPVVHHRLVRLDCVLCRSSEENVELIVWIVLTDKPKSASIIVMKVYTARLIAKNKGERRPPKQPLKYWARFSVHSIGQVFWKHDQAAPIAGRCAWKQDAGFETRKAPTAGSPRRLAPAPCAPRYALNAS